MMKIITLTLNPAFDIHCYTKEFMPYHENLVEITAREAGGKGVNISRALTVNGVANTAVAVLGDENAESFRRSLKADGIEFREILVNGRIRENMTLHTDDRPETRISFSGFTGDESLLSRVEQTLMPMLGDHCILTLTGRNPSGISVEAVKEMLSRIKETGTKIILDSRSFSKEDLLEVKPYLIKPNEEEISYYTDIEVTDFASAATAAKNLRKRGIENVMISLGSRGAMLACKDGCFMAKAPRICALSTVGAGDSSIAGFLAAAQMGLPYSERLRYAVCYGTAACLSEGTRPPKPSDVEKLLCVVESVRL